MLLSTIISVGMSTAKRFVSENGASRPFILLSSYRHKTRCKNKTRKREAAVNSEKGKFAWNKNWFICDSSERYLLSANWFKSHAMEEKELCSYSCSVKVFVSSSLYLIGLPLRNYHRPAQLRLSAEVLFGFRSAGEKNHFSSFLLRTSSASLKIIIDRK